MRKRQRQRDNQPQILLLRSHLNTEHYSAGIKERYLPEARRFLDYLQSNNLSADAVNPLDVEKYLRQQLRAYRGRRGHAPQNMRHWRLNHTSAVHMLLRLICGRWPPPGSTPLTEHEAFHHEIVRGYDDWMRDLRGLAPETRSDRCAEALRFLGALPVLADDAAVATITISRVDSYLQQRGVSQSRCGLSGVANRLRSFLNYLYTTGRVELDLAASVTGPKQYALEKIPSALRPTEVERVLRVTRQDRSAKGVRDYAILMLLSTYGLRAGEITMLRLEDIDWRNDILRVRHQKTGAYSELPLLSGPGDAVLAYLKHGRPKVLLRELFIRARAPYRAFTTGSSLYALVTERLADAGLKPDGKKGPHAFRHARAASLLRAAVPIKEIGDVLGHRSSESTMIYLKLATEDLRDVALDIPTEVSP